jgi:hypothetical protein
MAKINQMEGKKLNKVFCMAGKWVLLYAFPWQIKSSERKKIKQAGFYGRKMGFESHFSVLH